MCGDVCKNNLNMSETIDMSEPVGFPATPSTPELEAEYYGEETKRIAEGGPVWMQRNFNTDTGRILDYYKNRWQLGFIEQDYEDMLCDAYKAAMSDPLGNPIRLTDEPISFQEAVNLLLEAVRE
jgi:hypothetical protein